MCGFVMCVCGFFNALVCMCAICNVRVCMFGYFNVCVPVCVCVYVWFFNVWLYVLWVL